MSVLYFISYNVVWGEGGYHKDGAAWVREAGELRVVGEFEIEDSVAGRMGVCDCAQTFSVCGVKLVNNKQINNKVKIWGMVKRQYKIVYTNMLNIFNTVEYIQTYSLYSIKVSLRIIQVILKDTFFE